MKLITTLLATLAATSALLAQDPAGKMKYAIPEGDIWLCSGQSNMELPIRRCMDVVADSVKDYVNEDIHYLKVPVKWAFDAPQATLPACEWQTLTTPETSAEWGALCYFLGRFYNEKTGRPVSIINSSVGGSPIEAWLPEDRLSNEDILKSLALCKDPKWVEETLRHNHDLYGEWQEELDALPANTAAKWHRMPLFGTRWSVDEEGKPIYGSHYFKKTVRLNARQAAGEAILHLGAIVDADSVFVNGQYVGNTTYQYPPRNYTIPAGVLKKGRNVIDVHLQSHAGGPAHFVADKEYSLETAAGVKSLLKGWKYKAGVRMHARDNEDFLQYKPTGLYNAMIAPIPAMLKESGRKLAGVVWYQGESNTSNAEEYAGLLKKMIECWRDIFEDPQLKFYIVELAAFQHSELETARTSDWVKVQDAQRQVCEEMENVFLVPNRDLGEWNDIHPQDKVTPARRLVELIEQ